VYIKALDVNNKQGKTALEIRINIKTPFYKAFWFWVAASFLGTAFSFWFYNRQKTNRQKAKFNRQLDLEQQRNKITADLHDNIGASLSSLQVNSSIANQLIDKDANLAKPVLKKIENQAKNLADTIGDIIWSMKPGKDEFMTMSSRIKNFANDILGATDIDYEIKIDNRMDTLINDITIRKNIVFIAREAINNAVKYSKASKITISVQIQKQQLALLIGDNGVGFDVKYARGNGIVNMKKRAEELKADFQIKTTLQQGTEISILIPIPEFNDTP
jgi:signal transduction histidine kinase